MQKKNNPVYFLADLILLVVLLLMYEPHATGGTLHEWMGIFIASLLIMHMLMHWRLILCSVKKFFSRIGARQRLNFMINLSIFISFSTIIFSGLMISRNVLPSMGMATGQLNFWKHLHFLSVDISIWLVAFHFALNWPLITHLIKSIHLKDGFRKPVPQPAMTDMSAQAILDVRRGRKILRYAYFILIILALSGIISLGWYGISKFPVANNSAVAQGPISMYRQSLDLGSGRRNHHFSERDSDFRAIQGKGFRGYHEFSGQPWLAAVPGITKNILIISFVTGAIFFAGNRWKK